jgi:flagellar biosynthetic protein FliR
MSFAGQALLEIQTYLMVLARIGGLFGFAPVFGSQNIPRQAKIALSLVLALVIFPGVSLPATGYPENLIGYTLCIGREIIVGIVIGYVAALITVSVQLAGQLIDMQIGFGLVNVLDPVSGRQVTVIGQLQYIVAILLFLGTNSHHILLTAILESYRLVPVAEFTLSAAFHTGIVALFRNMFSLAFKIAAPVTCALLLTDVVMAILARAVPQMNIFIVGFPLKILAGLLVLAMAIPAFAGLLRGSFCGLERDIVLVLRGAR